MTKMTVIPTTNTFALLPITIPTYFLSSWMRSVGDSFSSAWHLEWRRNNGPNVLKAPMEQKKVSSLLDPKDKKSDRKKNSFVELL